MSDIHLYSPANVLAQTPLAPERLGYYEVRFYTENGRPVKYKTDSVETFYFYPSGGTIRDKEMNIVFYEPKLDSYKEFMSGL